MPDENEVVPSQHEANKLVRVLNGQKLKFTIRVYLPDQRVVEWQSNEVPEPKFNDEDRGLWLQTGNYPNKWIMRWVDGAVMLCEENPK